MRTVFPPDPTMLSEADVQAFADGSLEPERAAQVQRYLSTRPDEARRVAFYGRLNQQMRMSFEDGTAALPSMFDAHASAAQSSHRALRIAAVFGWLRAHARRVALLALLLVAVLGAALWAQRVPSMVLDAAALMVLEHSAQPGALPAGAAANANPNPLRDSPNLADLGWQAVARTSAPVGPWAHATGFIYRNRAGDCAVLLTVRDWTAASQPQWQARRVGGLRLLGWTAAHTRYVLAGRAQMAGLMRAADEMAPR